MKGKGRVIVWGFRGLEESIPVSGDPNHGDHKYGQCGTDSKWRFHFMARWRFQACFEFSTRSLGKISNLTSMFQMGWFKHQPDGL